MTTNILWNGSKGAGEEPDTIAKLEERLAEYTLMPSLAPFAAPCPSDPAMSRFFGNFVDYSHSFSIDTDDPELIERLGALIKTNMRTPLYTSARIEYERRQDRKAGNALSASNRWR
jgi:hypothetical protein